MYRRLRLCSDRGGYEAVADPARPIDLGIARKRLEADGLAVLDARVMLIVSMEVEVTLSRSGRLLFKTPDVRAAGRTFERLRTLLGLPPMEAGGPPGADSG